MTHTTSTTSSTSSTSVTAPQMEQIDPTTLLIDLNVRADATPDRALIDSVRDLGVLVPLVAVRTHDGSLRVRYGHRRARAATAAGAATVPVWVFDATGTDGTDCTDVDRIVRQWAENEHRTALTDADRLAAVEQLSAFGVSAAQITKRLRAPRRQVDAALTAASSAVAKAAVARFDFLDLLQAATLAEFDGDDDTETVKALVAAAKQDPGQFEHIAQRARDAHQARAREQAARYAVAATGVSVLDGRAPSRWADGPERLLTELTDPGRQPITATEHATCPGHGAYLVVEHGYWTDAQAATVRLADEPPSATTVYAVDPADYDEDEDHIDEGHEVDHDERTDDTDTDDTDTDAETGDSTTSAAEDRLWQARFAAAYVCTDHTTHGHQSASTDAGYGRRSTPAPATAADAEAHRSAASAERKSVIEHNRNWTSAEKVRRTFVTTLLRRKNAPKGAARFVAGSLIEGTYAIRRAMEGQSADLCDLLGLSVDGAPTSTTVTRPRPATLLEDANDARAQVLTLAVVLAAYEAATGKHSWRNVDPGTARYLQFLIEQGYVLSEVERLACGWTPPTPTQDDESST